MFLLCSIVAGMKTIFLILYNIRSAHNVGSIMRTADAFGVSKMFLIGHTPAPLDRFGKVQKDIAKVALGAELTVAWEQYATITPLIKKLKKEGVEILALEQSKKSVDYKSVKTKKQTALILGSEVEGIPESVLKHCDRIIEISMRGSKESLNVSVATGVALARLTEV